MRIFEGIVVLFILFEVIVVDCWMAESICSWRETNFCVIHVLIETLPNASENAFLTMFDILFCIIPFCLAHTASRVWNCFVNQVASYLNWFWRKFIIEIEVMFSSLWYVRLRFTFLGWMGTWISTLVDNRHDWEIKFSTSSSSTSYKIKM